jgi:hypothetical protein
MRSKFGVAVDDLEKAARDYGSDWSARATGSRAQEVVVAKAEVVALYDAMTKLAQGLLDYMVNEPIGLEWVGPRKMAPREDLVELTQWLNRCKDAGLVVKA